MLDCLTDHRAEAPFGHDQAVGLDARILVLEHAQVLFVVVDRKSEGADHLGFL